MEAIFLFFDYAIFLWLFFLIVLPFLLILTNYIKLVNFVYLLKFLLFYIVTFIYSIIYLLLFFFFFTIKNLRFFELHYFNNFMNYGKIYVFFKNKFIYFLFWRYVFIFVLKNIFNFILYLVYNIKSIYLKFLYINNIYMVSFLLLKIKLLLYNNFLFKFYLNFIQFFFIKILFNILYILHIDEFFRIFKGFNILNKLKYKEDPLFFRNYFLKIPLNFYNLYMNCKNNLINYNLYDNINYFINLFLIFIFQIVYKFNLYDKYSYLYNFFLKKIILIFFLKKNYINKHILNKIIFILLYFLNFIIINIIYLILNFIFFLIYAILYNCIKLKKWFIYFILIIFVFKYFWIINYFFLILYKHYSLYFPLYEIKESFRFLNFEWIDLRNYYNLLVWHNTLVDLSVHNNIIYNSLLKNLYNNLSLYGFKISKLHNINFKSIYWVKSQKLNYPESILWNNKISKDTNLLNNLIKKQNKALSLDKYFKYRFLKKHILIKLKTKFKVTRWNRVHKYYKGIYHVNRKIKGMFDNKLSIWSNSIYDLNSYKLLKNALPLKESYKDRLSLLSYYYRGSLKKKVSKKYVAIPISKYIRLRNIPLKKIMLQYKININLKNFVELCKLFNESLTLKEKKSWWFKYYKKLSSKITLLYSNIINYNNKANHIFFFKRIYSFNIYKNKINYKNKIPTYNWVESIWKRRVLKPVFSMYGMTNTTEAYTLNTYYDLTKKSILVKPRFNFKYILRKYPYRLNNYNGVIKTNLYYLNLLPKGIKIIKKYIFLQNLKRKYFLKFHNNFYEENKLYSNIILKKLRNWNKPFIHKHYKPFDLKLHKLKLYKNSYYKRVYWKNLKYWNFFDYFKVNKYYMYKYKDIYNGDNIYSINLNFIKRFRKDYINSRNYLIRFMSAYFYYEYFKKISLLAKIKPSKNKPGIKTLDFRLRWNFNVYLSHKKEKKENTQYIYMLCCMFKYKFKMYYKYVNFKVNLHNKIYKKNIQTYKIKVLNRIINLKRFFYYRTKRFNGWSILNYIRSFSLKFHIKHLLWHSPYSFLFFDNKLNNQNKNYIIENKFIFNYDLCIYSINNQTNNFSIYFYSILKKFKINKINKVVIINFIKNYFKKKNISLEQNLIKSILLNNAIKNTVINLNINVVPIKFNKYSLIFNLYLNIVDIKEDWSYYILNDIINYNQPLLFIKAFNNYYCNGHRYLNYKNLNILEAYRVFISLLFKYYNNFLYNLSRYLYILNFKKYTLIQFFERYFNLKSWFNNFYIKFRFQLNPAHLFGKQVDDNFYQYVLHRKNKYSNRVHRIEIAPFWFIFYKYTKIFVYFLLNKYYTKNYLIKWWLNYKLKLNLFLKLLLVYFEFQYELKFNILYNYNYIIYNFIEIKKFILIYKNLIINNIILTYNLLKKVPYFYNVFYNAFDYDFIMFNYNGIKHLTMNSNYLIYKNYIKIIMVDIFKSIYFFCDFFKDFILNIFYINKMFVILFNKFNILFKNILNLLNIYIWYLNIIFKSCIFDIIVKFILFIDLNKLKWFLKIFILKISLNISVNFNLNNFFLYKFYIKSLISYFIDILFKIKNKMVYYKSNYYNYRQIQALGKLQKYKTKISKTFINVQTRRNYISFYNLTFNNFFFKNLYSFDLNTYIYIWNYYDIKLNIKLLFSPFIFLKYNYGSYFLFICWLLYIIFLIFIFIFYKKFFNLFFFSKKINQINTNTQYNWNLFRNKKAFKILNSRSAKEKALFYNYFLKKNNYKDYHFTFVDKFYKYFNSSAKVINTSKILRLKAFFIAFNNGGKFYVNLKKYININNNILLDISKQKIFINFPYIYNNKLLNLKKFFNLFNFNFYIYKKENKIYNFSSNVYLYSNNILYFLFFYWLFLIPIFFIEYFLYRYHLRGHILKKRKLVVLLKVFLDNFKIYVKLVKLLGDQVFNHKLKSKYVRNNLNSYIYHKKRKLRKDYFFKWDRLNNLYLRMSPLGSYYYWFSRIDKWHYFICYYKYFFNSIYKSYYIKYFSFLYLFICFIFYKKICKFNNNLYKIKYKKFNLYKLKSLLSYIKL